MYDHRSEIVHGFQGAKKATPQLGDHRMRTAGIALVLLRLVVTEGVQRGEPIDVSALDAQVLTHRGDLCPGARSSSRGLHRSLSPRLLVLLGYMDVWREGANRRSPIWALSTMSGASASSDSGDVCGEEVDAVSVEVAAGSVVMLGGPRVGVPGEDLGIA